MHTKNKCLFAILIVIFAFVNSNISFAYSDAYDGEAPWATVFQNGTKSAPYLIYTVDDLKKIGNDPDWAISRHYKLMNNLRLQIPIEGQSNWVPIGTYEKPFTGGFDGNNKSISNIVIVNSELKYVGFFGAIKNSGEIKDLSILNINTKEPTNNEKPVNAFFSSYNSFVGGLSGYAHNVSIKNCNVSGNIEFDRNGHGGGLLGEAWYVTLEKCYAKINIDHKRSYDYHSFSGGIIAYSLYSKISSCYSTGKIAGGVVGGILGYGDDNNSIEDCYSIATLCNYDLIGGSYSGSSYDCDIGGIAGVNTAGVIRNCYFAGTIVKSTFMYYAGITFPHEGANILENCIVACNTYKVGEPEVQLINYILNPYRNPYYEGVLLKENDRTFKKLDNNYILRDIILNALGEENERDYPYDKAGYAGGMITKEELREQSTYEKLGWSFSGDNPIWEFSGDYALPKLVGVGGQDSLVTPSHLK